jgi:cyclomaltodextrin glucanotransferase
LQVNDRLDGDVAVFYRVYEKDGVAQTALVLLNKGDDAATLSVSRLLSAGTWRDAFSGQPFSVDSDAAALNIDVPAHGARVLFFDEPISNPRMLQRLEQLQAKARRRTP